MEDAAQSARERIVGSLPLEKDPASPSYVFHPEHERLSNIYVDEISNPSLTPRLPALIGYFTGISGPHGRESFYVGAMRRRCELLGRPMTPVEMKVLGRYTTNMQTGAEYFGFIGFTTATYRGYVTGLWPLENFWRNALGLGSNEAPSGSKVPPAGSQSFESAAPGEHGPKVSNLTSNKPLSGLGGLWSKVLTPGPTASLWQKFTVRFGNFLVRGMDKRLEQIPEDKRNTFDYKKLKEIRDSTAKMMSFVGDQYERQKYLDEATEMKSKEPSPELKKFMEEVDQKLASIKGKTPAEEQALKTEYITARLEQKFKPSINSEIDAEAEELRRLKEYHRSKVFLMDKLKATLGLDEQMNPKSANPVPEPKPLGLGNDPMSRIRNVIRLSTWAVLGKYAFTAVGLTFLSIRSRAKEQADDRLQEYHHDRMENAKVILQEQIDRARSSDPTRRGPGMPRQPPPPPSRSADMSVPVGEDDTQSLGGLQEETIFWGDQDKSGSRSDGSSERVSSSGRGSEESPWARAKRERNQAATKLEEDRYDTPNSESSSMNDTGNMSVWERIRQQTSSDFGSSGERQIPGESTQPTDAWTGRNTKSEKQTSKEAAQKEFDEQLEKERRGESDGWIK